MCGGWACLGWLGREFARRCNYHHRFGVLQEEHRSFLPGAASRVWLPRPESCTVGGAGTPGRRPGFI